MGTFPDRQKWLRQKMPSIPLRAWAREPHRPQGSPPLVVPLDKSGRWLPGENPDDLDFSTATESPRAELDRWSLGLTHQTRMSTPDSDACRQAQSIDKRLRCF